MQKTVFRILIVLVCAATQLLAQSSSSTLDLEQLGTLKQQSSNANLLTGEQVAVFGVVDPDVYVVGPGDVISYQTSGLDFSEKTTVVTPENTLLLERFGMLKVDGLTLSQVRDSIGSLVKKRASTMEVFVTLRRPRLVYVTLKGDVQFSGTYSVPASMKIGSIVALASQPWLMRTDNVVVEQYRQSAPRADVSSAARQQRISKDITPYALRNITVKNRDRVMYVDIAGANAKGKASLNPHVREGDEIYVPYEPTSYPSISISGAVVESVTLPFRKGDVASILLKAAGGATPDADLQNVVLVHPGSSEKIILQVTPSLDVIGNDPELYPGSTIILEHAVQTGVVQRGVVEVNGEVAKPGAVVIVPGVTRLSDVIASAGGITKEASTNLAYVVRPDVNTNFRDIRENASRKFMYSDLKLEDTTRYMLDQTLRAPYVSCDVTKALADTNSRNNIVLLSGDIIVVPKVPDRIYVYGQVNQAGYVTYTANKSLKWYIDLAGGEAQGARMDRARIIRGKSKVWVEDGKNIVVEPGDEVYVPRSPDVPIGTDLQSYAILAGIISSAVAVAATVISILSR